MGQQRFSVSRGLARLGAVDCGSSAGTWELAPGRWSWRARGVVPVGAFNDDDYFTTTFGFPLRYIPFLAVGGQGSLRQSHLSGTAHDTGHCGHRTPQPQPQPQPHTAHRTTHFLFQFPIPVTRPRPCRPFLRFTIIGAFWLFLRSLSPVFGLRSACASRVEVRSPSWSWSSAQSRARSLTPPTPRCPRASSRGPVGWGSHGGPEIPPCWHASPAPPAKPPGGKGHGHGRPLAGQIHGQIHGQIDRD